MLWIYKKVSYAEGLHSCVHAHPFTSAGLQVQLAQTCTNIVVLQQYKYHCASCLISFKS